MQREYLFRMGFLSFCATVLDNGELGFVKGHETQVETTEEAGKN